MPPPLRAMLVPTDTYEGVDANNNAVDVTAVGNCNASGQCLGNGAVCANDDQCYSKPFRVSIRS